MSEGIHVVPLNVNGASGRIIVRVNQWGGSGSGGGGVEVEVEVEWSGSGSGGVVAWQS